MATEAETYGALRKAIFSKRGQDKFGQNAVHIARIEAWNKAGIPDINMCWGGNEVWVENKCVNSGFKINFRRFQSSWMVKRSQAGGRVWMMVWSGKHQQTFLYSGQDALDIEKKGLHKEPRFRFYAPVDYFEVAEVLLTVNPRF